MPLAGWHGAAPHWTKAWPLRTGPPSYEHACATPAGDDHAHLLCLNISSGREVPPVWHMHPEPGRRSLKQRDIALAPLVVAQQLGRFGRRHADSRADLGGRGDAAVFQLPKDQHPQADCGQLVGVSGVALFGRELRLLFWAPSRCGVTRRYTHQRLDQREGRSSRRRLGDGTAARDLDPWTSVANLRGELVPPHFRIESATPLPRKGGE